MSTSLDFCYCCFLHIIQIRSIYQFYTDTYTRTKVKLLCQWWFKPKRKSFLYSLLNFFQTILISIIDKLMGGFSVHQCLLVKNILEIINNMKAAALLWDILHSKWVSWAALKASYHNNMWICAYNICIHREKWKKNEIKRNSSAHVTESPLYLESILRHTVRADCLPPLS